LPASKDDYQCSKKIPTCKEGNFMKKPILILIPFLFSLFLFAEEGTPKKCSDFSETECPKEKCKWAKNENGKPACVDTKGPCRYCTNKNKKKKVEEIE
jgi:hypothetical protein